MNENLAPNQALCSGPPALYAMNLCSDTPDPLVSLIMSPSLESDVLEQGLVWRMQCQASPGPGLRNTDLETWLTCICLFSFLSPLLPLRRYDSLKSEHVLSSFTMFVVLLNAAIKKQAKLKYTIVFSQTFNSFIHKSKIVPRRTHYTASCNLVQCLKESSNNSGLFASVSHDLTLFLAGGEDDDYRRADLRPLLAALSCLLHCDRS